MKKILFSLVNSNYKLGKATKGVGLQLQYI
jgi:hypothetical protein